MGVVSRYGCTSAELHGISRGACRPRLQRPPGMQGGNHPACSPECAVLLADDWNPALPLLLPLEKTLMVELHSLDACSPLLLSVERGEGQGSGYGEEMETWIGLAFLLPAFRPWR